MTIQSILSFTSSCIPSLSPKSWMASASSLIQGLGLNCLSKPNSHKSSIFPQELKLEHLDEARICISKEKDKIEESQSLLKELADIEKAISYSGPGIELSADLQARLERFLDAVQADHMTIFLAYQNMIEKQLGVEFSSLELISFIKTSPHLLLCLQNSEGLSLTSHLINCLEKEKKEIEMIIHLINLLKMSNSSSIEPSFVSIRMSLEKEGPSDTNKELLTILSSLESLSTLDTWKSLLIEKIEESEKRLHELRNNISFDVEAIPSHQSIPIFLAEQTLKDLLDLQSMISEGSSSSDIVDKINKLPGYITSNFAHIIWHVEGEPNIWEFGMKKLFESPSLLTQIKNESDQSLLSSMITFVSTKYTLLQMLQKNPDLDEVKKQLQTPFLGDKILSFHSTDVERVAKKVNTFTASKVAIISAECKGVLSQGGLGEAVLGMTEALGKERSIVIMPFYGKMAITKEADTSKQELPFMINGRKVYFAALEHFNTMMIDDESFRMDLNSDGKVRSIYADGKSHSAQQRFALFQSLAATLSLKLYQERTIDVIHSQDSQMALIPKIIAHTHSSAWLKGETPPCVFTFHNNLHGAQGRYEMESVLDALSLAGLPVGPINSFIEGLDTADAVTTVSAKFALEAQSDGVLGRDVGRFVRKAAGQGKLFHILNGTSVSWNPKTNATLKRWQSLRGIASLDAEKIQLSFSVIKSSPIDIESQIQDFERDLQKALDEGKNVYIDLSYDESDHPLVIDLKKRLCKQELAIFVERYDLGRYDPSKPLVLNIGRFDASQKGIDKLPFLFHEAKRLNAQMISIGLDAESCPKIIEEAIGVCSSYERDGAILIPDERVSGKIKWQMGHTSPSGQSIPALGPILRAAADLYIFPSEFEPCGLVQGEAFLFGARVIATDTGGFHDTVFTSGEDRNGWLFAREENFRGPSQNLAISKTLTSALSELYDTLYKEDKTVEDTIEFYKQSQRIMTNAKLCGWNQSLNPSLLTPKEKLDAVYQFAIKNKTNRNTIKY